MNVYIAQPIDKRQIDAGVWIAESIKDVTKAADEQAWPMNAPIAFYNPMTSYVIAGPIGKRTIDLVVHTNLQALWHCDVLLLYYSKGQETWGCPIEMWEAVNHNIPILLVTDDMNTLPMYLRYSVQYHPKSFMSLNNVPNDIARKLWEMVGKDVS